MHTKYKEKCFCFSAYKIQKIEKYIFGKIIFYDFYGTTSSATYFSKVLTVCLQKYVRIQHCHHHSNGNAIVQIDRRLRAKAHQSDTVVLPFGIGLRLEKQTVN